MHRSGTRRREDFAPADLMRGLERDRARLMDVLMVNPGTWEIARTLWHVMRGYPGEGLRGIYDPQAGNHGAIHWWPANKMAHQQGRLLLGFIADRRSDAVLEVEANVADNGTIYLAWGTVGAQHSERFLAHPSIGKLIDGCLTSGGRQIYLTREGIKRSNTPRDDRPIEAVYEAVRKEGWDVIRERVTRWTKTRRLVNEEGNPVPAASSLRPLRHFINDQTRWNTHPPVPEMTANADRTVTLQWSGRGSGVTMIFRDHEVHIRINNQGRAATMAPIPARTEKQLAHGMPWTLHLGRFE